jgi:hypothetical protein
MGAVNSALSATAQQRRRTFSIRTNRESGDWWFMSQPCEATSLSARLSSMSTTKLSPLTNEFNKAPTSEI